MMQGSVSDGSGFGNAKVSGAGGAGKSGSGSSSGDSVFGGDGRTEPLPPDRPIKKILQDVMSIGGEGEGDGEGESGGDGNYGSGKNDFTNKKAVQIDLS